MKHNQEGVILFISMMLLFIISMVILSSTHTAQLQGKMTEALRDSQVSLNAVEAGFAQAELALNQMRDLSAFNQNGTIGFYSQGWEPELTLFDWQTDNSQRWNGVDGVEVRYYVVHLGGFGEKDTNTSLEDTSGYSSGENQPVQLFKIVVHSRGYGNITDGAAERTAVIYFGSRIIRDNS